VTVSLEGSTFFATRQHLLRARISSGLEELPQDAIDLIGTFQLRQMARVINHNQT
jgi:hypothetical protein